MNGRRIFLGSLVIGPILTATPAVAQETIPREVVEALFGPLRGADLLVGELPDPLPYGVPLPEGVTPIGALTRASSGIIAVAFPSDAGAAQAALVATLLERGWQRPSEENRPPQYGFVRSDIGLTDRIFCSDDAMLNFSTTRGTGRTVLRINYYTATERESVCSRSDARSGFEVEGPAPTLEVPENALVRSTGGSRSGTGEVGFSAHLETGLETAEVARHFGLEMTADGWTPATAPTVNEDAFIQRWAHEDGDGWGAVIVGIRTGPGRYALDLQMWPAGSR